jgi:hypothetical protein
MSRLSQNPYSVAVLALEHGAGCVFDAESVEQPVITMAANIGIAAALALGWWLPLYWRRGIGRALGARRRLLAFALLLVGPLRVHGLRVRRSASSTRHLLVRSGLSLEMIVGLSSLEIVVALLVVEFRDRPWLTSNKVM